MYTDERIGYDDSSGEHSPSYMQTAAATANFDFRNHRPNDFGQLLSAAVGHEQILHGAVNFNPDESDDDDDDDDDEEMSDEDYDEDIQSDGNESSADELNG